MLERVGLASMLVALVACSGGGGERSDGGTDNTPEGVEVRGAWSVTGSYEPDVVPNPEVVLWTAQVQGELHDPVLVEGVRTWRSTGTLTAMRWPSREPMGSECSASVSPDQQVITLDGVNTRVVLGLSDEEVLFSGLGSTSISYQKTVTCPDGTSRSDMLMDLIPWLSIPMTLREPEDVMLEGMETNNAGKRTWTLTKLED